MPEQFLFTKEKGSLFNVKVWMKLLVKKNTPWYGNKNRNRKLARGKYTMNLKKVHHIAIIGSNYEQSKHFYVDLLGFSIVRENYRPERDDYKIDLQLDDMELELFIIKNCPKRPSYPEAYGLRHLAFAVDSVDNTVYVKERGSGP